jgi:cbb3-type cytochrome oxidase cytochrome c subunit
MSDKDDISPEMAAKIAAIKARMKAGQGGGDAEAPKPKDEEAPTAEPAAESDAPKDDKAAQLAAIKARLAGGKAASTKAAPDAAAASAAEGGSSAGEGGGEDMQARIAALKAKVDSGKGKEAPAAAAGAKKAPAKKKGGKNVFPVQPINKKGFGDERLYGDVSVSRWFILSSIVLIASVLMMWGRDHFREWKPIQEVYRERQIERYKADIQRADAAIDPKGLGDVEARLEAARATLVQDGQKLEGLRAEVDQLEGAYYGANQKFQIAKSEFDALRYQFEEFRLLHGHDSELLKASREEIQKTGQVVDDLRLAADNANNILNKTKSRLAGFSAEVTQFGRDRDALVEEKVRLESSLKKIDHSIFNDFIRNAPVADMLAPTVKVEKVVLDKLQDNYNFMYVDKVDMCMTCHISIGDPYYTDWDPDNSKENSRFAGERVLNAHPRLDLFVDEKSPHPVSQFGCTVCHQGRGQAVEFERTFHTPAADAYETAEQKEERWIKDFGYDPERHYWDWPMTPKGMYYSSCFQCHTSTDRIPGVPKYNESRELVEEVGCYGCHKIKGFEHLRKRGPDLTNIAGKTTEEWSQKWAMAPKAFQPETRMPQFWDLSNVGGPGDPRQTKGRRLDNNADDFVDDWNARNAVEARAVIAYIFDQSKQAMVKDEWQPMTPPSGAADPEKGRAYFEERGCLGCHSVSAEGWMANQHAPDLSHIGSKVDPEWLYSWIMDPKSYYPTTVMPDLRLSPEEGWDITAWLMTLTDPEWVAEPGPKADPTILDGIAVEQLTAVAGDDWAKQRVADMRSEGGDPAVELFVGQKLFGRFGCAGCHLVPGHYDDVGIGTELTGESLKELSKFDFGHEAAHGNPEAVGHSRREFYKHKLIDPRVYDRMPVVAKDGDGNSTISYYEQKVKRPSEKLKMPDFGLEDFEVDLLTQFLLGLRADGISPSMMYTLDADQQLVEDGSRLITKFNCIGCHRMGQTPVPLELVAHDFDGRLANLEEAIEEGIDHGLWLADSVVVDGTTLFHKGDWLLDEYYDVAFEEDADVLEFFEDDPENRPIPDLFMVYGLGEGGMGTYIEDAALRPPVFRGQGAKVNPGWLFEFLIAPYIVRTHVEVRMPTFGLTEKESLALVRWFSHQEDEPWPFVVDTDAVLDQELFDTGSAVFTEFQCNQCHPSGDALPSNPDKSNWGPDLALASERLKPEWIYDWLQDPQQVAPGTRMPNFFGEFGDDEYQSYYDDWNDRIRAVQHYLKHIGTGNP